MFALASEIKPVLIVTICVAVALTEFEFSGAIFGAVGGMMWDISAGRQAGFFTITLMICCFFIGYSVRVFFRSNYFNIMVMTFATMFVVTALDFLFGYVIFNY
ncbi:MAG: rod shape-determining protein MreD, partial [Oscillospiraceae bacterium]